MKRIDAKTAAARLVDAPGDIYILAHKNPDGDTLGSAFALWDFFRQCGKRAAIKCPDAIGELYSMLTCVYADEDFAPCFIVAVDCADESRTVQGLAREVDLCIDHHESQTFFAKETFLSEHAASASELVLEVLEQAGCAITPYIASALYIGVSTDTGCFSYQNTTPNAHEAAARLIAAGAQMGEINYRFFRLKSKRRVALEAECLRGMEYRLEGKLLFFTLTLDFIEREGIRPDDYESLASVPMTFEGVEVGAVLREIEGGIKVSLRTMNINASAICQKFDGGGHFRAAGFESELGFDELKDALEACVRQELGQL